MGNVVDLDTVRAMMRGYGEVPDGTLLRFTGGAGSGAFDAGAVRAALSLLHLVGAATVDAETGALRLREDLRGLDDEQLCYAVLWDTAKVLQSTGSMRFTEDGGPARPGYKKPTGYAPKYPFKTLPVGGTFRVPPGPGQPTWTSFRTYCSNKGSALGKRFLCHRYPDGTYEVWRER